MTIDFEKLKHAYAVIDGIPSKNFNLYEWTTKGGNRTDCSTIACAAGWLIRHPDFQVPGFGLSPFGHVVCSDGRQHRGPLDGFSYVAELFGLPYGDAEQLFGSPKQSIGHKKEWQRRVREYLKFHGQLTEESV